MGIWDSQAIRKRFVDLHNSSSALKRTSRCLKVPYSSVQKLDKYKHRGNVLPSNRKETSSTFPRWKCVHQTDNRSKSPYEAGQRMSLSTKNSYEPTGTERPLDEEEAITTKVIKIGQISLWRHTWTHHTFWRHVPRSDETKINQFVQTDHRYF